MNVLVVAPHPDDEILGCGGTIAAHVADTVDVVIVTRGDDRYDQGWIEQSRKEAADAHEFLGVTKSWFLDFPSPTLDTVPHADIIDRLRSFTCDVAYIPARGDLHQEHRIVHDAARVAFRCGPDLYAYETPSETEFGYEFHPDHFVEIDIEAKQAALSCYRTQLHRCPSLRSVAGVKDLARVRGGAVGVEYAEAFETVRTTWRR